MRDAFLHFTLYILHLLQAVGVSLLFGMAVFAFGAWLRRMGVFAVARRLLWSARGAFLALALFAGRGRSRISVSARCCSWAKGKPTRWSA